MRSTPAHAAWPRVGGTRLGEEEHLQSWLAAPGVVQSKFCASSNSASGSRSGNQSHAGVSPMSEAPVMGLGQHGPWRAASLFPISGHPSSWKAHDCTCRLPQDKITPFPAGNAAFAGMQRNGAATVLSCKRRSANTTSECPDMHFLLILDADAEGFGEFSSRLHISSVL